MRKFAKMRVSAVVTLLILSVVVGSFITVVRSNTVAILNPEGQYASVYGNIIGFTDLSAHIWYYDGIGLTQIQNVQGSMGSGLPSVYGNRIAFFVIQAVNDWEIAYVDLPSTTPILTGQHVGPGWFLSLHGDFIAFSGLLGDLTIVYYYEIPGTNLVSTNTVGRGPDIYGNIIAFSTSEATLGVDLNGDLDISDMVIRYYDINSGVTVNTGQVGETPSIYRDIIAFTTSESQAGIDLNGDADLNDYVIRYYNIAAVGFVVNTGMVGVQPSLWDGILSFETDESVVNMDLNGDGDSTDHVIRYYNGLTGVFAAIGVAGTFPDVYGSFLPFTGARTLVFHTLETWVRDLNGDADTNDRFVRYVALPIQGDANGDGIVDIFDAILLSVSFGAVGDPQWDPRADLDGNGQIDVFDGLILARNFGGPGPAGDVNGDGIVDWFDAYIIESAIGSTGQPNFNPYADLNDNGWIDIFDAILLGQNFGSTLEDP